MQNKKKAIVGQWLLRVSRIQRSASAVDFFEEL
jgi:hypothetical protein